MWATTVAHMDGHRSCRAGPGSHSTLRLALDPDRVELAVNLNGAGDPFDLERAELAAEFPAHDPPAYSRLLLEILRGDQTLAIRGDEAEECWRIMEPILAAVRCPLRSHARTAGERADPERQPARET
jgi:glucose-6-phosphate 1-dehydrogenase